MIFYSILGSSIPPSFGESGLALYHFTSIVFSLIFAKNIYIFLLKNKYFLFFIFYILLFFVFEVLFAEFNSMTKVSVRFLNFLTSFSMMALVVIYFKTHREKLDVFVRHFIIVVTLFGFYQLIARIFDLPFGILENNRFRDFEYISQTTSFFREPRYYGSFIAVFLYIVLFYYKRHDRLVLISLLVLSGFLTQSLTAYFLLLIVGLLYTLRKINIISLVKITALASLVVIALLQFENVTNRLIIISNTDYAEVFLYLLDSDVGQDVDISGNLFGEICPVNAGCSSTVGEVGYLIQVLIHSPLFGYGVGYGFGDIYRVMALNGVTEFVLRWGVLGLALFFIAMFRNCKNKIRLFFIILAYMSALGNIAQPLFWSLISLIYIVHSGSLAHYKSIKQLNE